MYDTKKCQIEMMLIDVVEDALVKLNSHQQGPVNRVNDAHMGLITARALWEKHKVECPVCCRQLVN
ncbi:hypothetical protein [Tunturiibacter lichenicola]|uniref:hypothetical protein n=1 Tax=Tunturiibacter lichenicola TaxID=2051959 RepID=UPI0021B44C77|nr:hypothetical protein [Edaphobacter lichenicola]